MSREGRAQLHNCGMASVWCERNSVQYKHHTYVSLCQLCQQCEFWRIDIKERSDWHRTIDNWHTLPQQCVIIHGFCVYTIDLDTAGSMEHAIAEVHRHEILDSSLFPKIIMAAKAQLTSDYVTSYQCSALIVFVLMPSSAYHRMTMRLYWSLSLLHWTSPFCTVCIASSIAINNYYCFVYLINDLIYATSYMNPSCNSLSPLKAWVMFVSTRVVT